MINNTKLDFDRLNRFFDKKKCVECPNMFFIVKEGRARHKRPGIVKKRNTKTCSIECSRKFTIRQAIKYAAKYRKRKNFLQRQGRRKNARNN